MRCSLSAFGVVFKQRRMAWSWWLLITISWLTGCAQHSQIDRPAVDLEQWETPLSESTTPALSDWWRSFGSDALNQMMQQALAHNPDLSSAWLNLARAEIQLQGVQADRLPVTLSAGAEAQGGSSSATSGLQHQESSQLRLNISYEVDLWGRVAAQQAAGEAQLDASRYDLQAAQLSLTSRVAETWFQWLTLQAQQAEAQDQLARLTQQEQLVSARQRLGVATEAELASQRASRLQQQNQLTQIQQQSQQTRRALALLLGQSYQGWQPPQADLFDLALPLPDPGWPTALLTQRPDLARAEAQLRHAEANVVQARAALFPSVNLQASALLASETLFLHDPIRSLNLTSTLAQTLFDRGARQRQIALSDLQRQSLVETYRANLLNALMEVDNALEQVQVQQQLAEQQLALLAAQEAIFAQTAQRHRLGSASLSQRLEAQSQLARTREQQLQLQQAQLNARVQLYKALGGGIKQQNDTPE